MKQNFLGSFSLPDSIYHKPADLAEALALLRDYRGNCLLVAGCTDIIPTIRRGKLRPAPGTHWIDLKTVRRLQDITVAKETVTIGAAASYSAIMANGPLGEACPLLTQVARDIGSVQIRNVGTIGGNLCTASPGGDASVGLLALDAEVLIAGCDYEKRLRLADFFTGYGKTVLGLEEIVTAVRFAVMNSQDRWSWIKHGRRNAFTMSVLSVATRFRIERGTFAGVHLAMGLAGPTPLRLTAVEQFLMGRGTDWDVIREAAEIAAKSVHPRSSFRAAAEYRSDLARVLTERALTEALNRNAAPPESPREG